MTIFGVIWLGMLIISMFFDIKYLFLLTILSSVFQCNNVFVFQGTGIGPQVITSLVFVLRVFLLRKHNFKIRLNKNFIILEILCIVLVFIAFISLLINQKLSNSFLRYMQLVIYVLCFIAMSKVSEHIDDNFVYLCIKKISIFLITIGFLQLLITTGHFPRLWLIRELIYNDTLSDVVYFTRNNYFRILATYMEPSYYACFIVGAFYYFLLLGKKTKENVILMILMFIQIILTFSSTAYISFVVLGIIYLTREKNLKIKLITFFLGIIGIMILYFGFYNILDTVIFSKAQSGSANARFAWNDRAIKYFENNKIIGVGYKTLRASSVIYTLLAEMGIIRIYKLYYT